MSSSGKMRVLCVDDNKLLADALRAKAQRIDDLEWLGAFHEADDLLNRIFRIAPHVVLMDVDMPGVDTFRIVEELAAKEPKIRAVMLSGYVTQQYIDRALDAGAWGYLSKNDDVSELIAGMRKVHAGDIAFSRDVEIVSQRKRSTLAE